MPSQPSKELETFDNPMPERDYTIRIDVPVCIYVAITIRRFWYALQSLGSVALVAKTYRDLFGVSALAVTGAGHAMTWLVRLEVVHAAHVAQDRCTEEHTETPSERSHVVTALT
jgi:hypothetical protein